ncbi:MAG: hypothetical protein ACJ79A_08520 [Gemmatimonadaceae bacterium]
MTSAHVARAQTSAMTTRDGWLVGALVGRMRVEDWPDAHATAIGVGATRFGPQRPGLDLAVVTIPRLFRDGQIPLHGRIGVAVPLGSRDGPFLIPTVGVDAAGVAGETAGGWVGYHWGARALLATRKLGVQAGVIWVRAVNAPNTLWLAELGLMRVPSLRPPKPRPTTPVPGET